MNNKIIRNILKKEKRLNFTFKLMPGILNEYKEWCKANDISMSRGIENFMKLIAQKNEYLDRYTGIGRDIIVPD